MPPNLAAYLTGWETREFPAATCTVPNEREPNVFDAPAAELYLVLLVDKRFACNGRLELARPYVCDGYDEENKPSRFFGWADQNGNVFDHFVADIHGDSSRVVAWRKVETTFDLRKLFPTW